MLLIERSAFGQDNEAELVRNLLADPSAKPILSLLAFKGDKPVGHILFTTAHLAKSRNPTSISILAPLAIVPDVQKQGIGGKLIERGLQLLSRSGVDLVFVLGYPQYYLAMASSQLDAWDLRHHILFQMNMLMHGWCKLFSEEPIGSVTGTVMCADTLNKPEYWRE